ncbi:peptide deformylase [Blattabacterium sp. (Cryptocercus kyebangensis)]|uniref:peptide deformylase n=1 Tax=Blattabacterium sp. (Cryptocercus kyebangensis) TaxID=298656 RepID=UPI000D7CE47F|nr:peptide deformylase [Blattabacterium sp. (Cryptocercus kyebangensis)]AWU43851.1 peptide deformylase [Blattabacterium sp. (Cryptocercus kyebangensis)]
MILPIILYGNPILRKKCIDIYYRDSRINKLIKNMFETIHKVKGIGLAAPQIGKNIRLFIVKTPYLSKNGKNNYKEVFINARILKIYGEECEFNEGCLSLPGIMGYVKRKSHLLIEYYDNNWNKKKRTLKGICARVIQHEYDHIEGKLFIDYFSSMKRKLIEKKLMILLERKKLSMR